MPVNKHARMLKLRLGAIALALSLLAMAAGTAAADASQILIREPNVLVRLDDGALYFHGTWIMKNSGQTKVAPLTVNLQAGYTGLSIARGPSSDKIKATAQGFEDNEGVEAGAEKEYVLSYRMPHTSGSTASLSFTQPYAADSLVLLLDQKLELVGSGFTKGEVVSMGPSSYVQYGMGAVKANQAVTIEVKPRAGAAPGTSTGTGADQATSPKPAGAGSDQIAVAFLVVLALLLFGAVGFLVIARSRGSQRRVTAAATAVDRVDGGKQSSEAGSPAGRTSVALDTPEKLKLVEFMADLDRRYEAGNIGETEYHQERAKAKSKLTALILASQQDPAGSAGSAGGRHS